MNEAKLPPHDTDAEEAVIGSLLIDGTAIYQIADFLQVADFYYEQNQWLYEACRSLYERDEAVNQITVAQELSRRGRLESCGGAAQLSYLISIALKNMILNRGTQYLKNYSSVEADAIRSERETRMYMVHKKLYKTGAGQPKKRHPANRKRH